MADDRVFCAKTGRQIIEPSSVERSNVIPFPRRASDPTKPERPQNHAEQVTIRSSATFEDIDKAARAEIAAIDQCFDDLEDI